MQMPIVMKREQRLTMERRGKKRDYSGRTGDVIRLVKGHPTWTYARVGETFGVSRQAVSQLIITEERRTRTRLHVRQNRSKPFHLERCRACRMAIRKLQRDPAQVIADLYPNREHRGYHLAQIRRAGALKDAILFRSKKRLMAYRAWRDGMSAVEIERRYGFRNWLSCINQLEGKCSSWGRREKCDLRPNWQKDLEGHDIKRLTRFKLYGSGVVEKTGRRVPFNQSVHARNKRLAVQNAEVTLLKMRGIKPITLRVERWGNGER